MTLLSDEYESVANSSKVRQLFMLHPESMNVINKGALKLRESECKNEKFYDHCRHSMLITR